MERDRPPKIPHGCSARAFAPSMVSDELNEFPTCQIVLRNILRKTRLDYVVQHVAIIFRSRDKQIISNEDVIRASHSNVQEQKSETSIMNAYKADMLLRFPSFLGAQRYEWNVRIPPTLEVFHACN